MPTYSIIIPIYNAEKHLRKCIDSIINQTVTDWEILLINDGSTDKSADICEQYSSIDNRIKVIHKINGGVSSARNLGINNARGHWITFIDADDFIEQNYFPTTINEKSDLIIQNWSYNSSNENIQTLYAQHYTKNMLPKYFKENIHLLIFQVPWGKFYRKRIIDINNIRFNENFIVGEDTLFVSDYLLFCNSIEIIATSTYKYTPNNNPHKYKVALSQSLLYLSTYFKSYKKLNSNNLHLLYKVYQGYWNYTENITDPIVYHKWICSHPVKLFLKELYNTNILIFYYYYIKTCLYSILKLLR